MIRVQETPNPTPQSGGPRTMYTLYDEVARWCVSRAGKPVSGHAASLFEDRVGAQACADDLNARMLFA